MKQFPVIKSFFDNINRQLKFAIREAFSAKRILIVSPFPENITRPTSVLAKKRNRVMFEIADKIVLGYVDPNGELIKLKAEFEEWKVVTIL